MKGADGVVAAEEIVFGNFTTRAGTITNVDAAAQEVTVKEVGSGQAAGDPGDGRFAGEAHVGPPGHDRDDARLEAKGEHGASAGGAYDDDAGRDAGAAPRGKGWGPEAGDIVIVSSTRGAKPDRSRRSRCWRMRRCCCRSSRCSRRGTHGQPVPASASLDMLSSMGFGVVQ